MPARPSHWMRPVALAVALAGLYVGLALHGHAPGGWRLRTLVHSPAEIAEAARQDHRADRLQGFANERVRPGGVLFIGSSTIEFFDLAAAFPEAHAINRGIGDEDLSGLRARFAGTLDATACAAIVLYAGSVDFRRLERPSAEIAREVAELLEMASSAAPNARVVLLGILPERDQSEAMAVRLESTNRALEALAESRPTVSFVNTCRPPVAEEASGALARGMSRDRIHLNERGYKEAASWILHADEVVGRLLGA
jgi:lysophospholipase L1-like esterase